MARPKATWRPGESLEEAAARFVEDCRLARVRRAVRNRNRPPRVVTVEERVERLARLSSEALELKLRAETVGGLAAIAETADRLRVEAERASDSRAALAFMRVAVAAQRRR